MCLHSFMCLHKKSIHAQIICACSYFCAVYNILYSNHQNESYLGLLGFILCNNQPDNMTTATSSNLTTNPSSLLVLIERDVLSSLTIIIFVLEIMAKREYHVFFVSECMFADCCFPYYSDSSNNILLFYYVILLAASLKRKSDKAKTSKQSKQSSIFNWSMVLNCWWFRIFRNTYAYIIWKYLLRNRWTCSYCYYRYIRCAYCGTIVGSTDRNKKCKIGDP